VVVSQPPDYPGRERFKRAAAAAGSEAYQGAFEAIGSVLIAGAFGYWVDYRWDTTPVGLLVGTAIGFAAMVLRLIRLGKEIHPDSTGAESGSAGLAGSKESNESNESKSGEQDADDLTFGESPGMSSVLRDELDEHDERNES
jgi:F0F1-type ATP synthase assembly protein I